LAAVSAAVSCIASTIAALPALVTAADDDRAEAPNHPLSRLIKNGCNSSETWFDLVEALLASALLRGNALVEIGTDGQADLRACEPCPGRA
jgi:phage portal protein BeeE